MADPNRIEGRREVAWTPKFMTGRRPLQGGVHASVVGPHSWRRLYCGSESSIERVRAPP